MDSRAVDQFAGKETPRASSQDIRFWAVLKPVVTKIGDRKDRSLRMAQCKLHRIELRTNSTFLLRSATQDVSFKFAVANVTFHLKIPTLPLKL